MTAEFEAMFHHPDGDTVTLVWARRYYSSFETDDGTMVTLLWCTWASWCQVS